MLDLNNPVTCSLAASRINALTIAASTIWSGDGLIDRLQRESIAIYLTDLAAELANEIADAADRAESMIPVREAPHHGA